MHTVPCPFCGVVTNVPHETQEGCIAALQEEIARVRGILEHSTPTGHRPCVGEAGRAESAAEESDSA
jgi:hypothetical protein